MFEHAPVNGSSTQLTRKLDDLAAPVLAVDSRVRDGLRRAAVIGVLVWVAVATGRTAAPVQHVLILQSFSRGSRVMDHITDTFRSRLETRTKTAITFSEFVLAPPGFAQTPERPTINFLQSAFAGQPKPDLVVTVGGPAAVFARSHRREFFPNTPLLFTASDERFVRDTPLADNETAATNELDYRKIVDDILQLFPDTANVLVVTGGGPLATLLHDALAHDFERFQQRLTFAWTHDLSYAQLLQRAKDLPPHSAILFVTSGTDVQGGWHGSDLAISELASIANAPMFGIQHDWLGAGIGGRLLTMNAEQATLAADAALRILQGESPSAVRIPPRPMGPPAYDARQLRRWGISEARLPPGSIVEFRGPSLWRDYRRVVIAALAAFLVQSVLIAGLVYERRARRNAERESRRSLTLAADVNRRATMSALSGSIAHELSQPLGAILHNAYAADRLVTSEQATPELLHQILTDICADDTRAAEIVERHRAMLRGTQFDCQPIDIHAVVRESLALAPREMMGRNVAADVDLPPNRDVVGGDRVLLQQVIVNLTLNA